MPKKNYFLDADKNEVLMVQWKRNFKNFTVTHDNREIMTFENKAELSAGKTCRLDSTRELSVQFVNRGWGDQGIEILLNKIPVRGTATDPYTILKSTWILLLVLAGLNLLVGIIAEAMQVNALQNMGIGIGSIIVGVIFVVLAVFIKEKQSMIALIVAILLLAADIVFAMAVAAPAHGAHLNSGAYVKIGIIIALFQGFRAIKKIKKLKGLSENSPLDQI